MDSVNFFQSTMRLANHLKGSNYYELISFVTNNTAFGETVAKSLTTLPLHK